MHSEDEVFSDTRSIVPPLRNGRQWSFPGNVPREKQLPAYDIPNEIDALKNPHNADEYCKSLYEMLQYLVYKKNDSATDSSRMQIISQDEMKTLSTKLSCKNKTFVCDYLSGVLKAEDVAFKYNSK